MDEKKCPGCLINQLYTYNAKFVEGADGLEACDSISFLHTLFYSCIPMRCFCDRCRMELLRSLHEMSKKEPETQNQATS